MNELCRPRSCRRTKPPGIVVFENVVVVAVEIDGKFGAFDLFLRAQHKETATNPAGAAATMAGLKGAALFLLLGTAAAQDCAADGSSAAYTESITTTQGITRRAIVATGCPNHESFCTGKPAGDCGSEGETSTKVEADEQALSVEVPANPKLIPTSEWNAVLAVAVPDGELDCAMGTVAYALNGVGFYGGAVGNKLLDPPCPQLDVSDAEAEWISFDCCGGHSSGTGGYHYHFPPSCLVAQANAQNPLSDGHSSQIGWAQDGFPIYGPLGPGGVEIRNCGSSGADEFYCQDACGGFEGELSGVDDYKYRYYITGKVGDLNSLPSFPKPDDADLYFPYTLRCHRGCVLSSASDFKECEETATDGFTSSHTATANPGYSAPVPVVCLDGNGIGDHDVFGVDSAPSPRPTREPTPEPTPEPSFEPTPEPTPEPTLEPTEAAVVAQPTLRPTPLPTLLSTQAPAPMPRPANSPPTRQPTLQPTAAPVVTGDMTISGLDLATAQANENVFVTAVAVMASVAEALVAVTIAEARRRLSGDHDHGVIVTYTIATSSSADADALVGTLAALTTEDANTALTTAAATHGADSTDVTVTELGAPAAVAATDADESEDAGELSSNSDAAAARRFAVVSAVATLAAALS